MVTSTPASVATMYSTQKDSMTISLTVNMWHKMTRIEALLDCGETHNFIDPQTIQALSMGTHPLSHPLIVKNVDGTIYQDGTIMHYCNLWVCQGQQMEKQGFYVANLGRDWDILGYPWFKSYNPDFDWNSNILKGEEVFIDMAGCQSTHCLVITTIQVTQEEITKDKEEVLKTIPPQYHQHWKVFSKHTSYWFPPACKEDHTIILKEGAPDTIDCRVYCQMEMELEATWQFITEALAKGYITDFKSPYALGLFYWKKKDGKLWPIMHHGLLHIK